MHECIEELELLDRGAVDRLNRFECDENCKWCWFWNICYESDDAGTHCKARDCGFDCHHADVCFAL